MLTQDQLGDIAKRIKWTASRARQSPSKNSLESQWHQIYGIIFEGDGDGKKRHPFKVKVDDIIQVARHRPPAFLAQLKEDFVRNNMVPVDTNQDAFIRAVLVGVEVLVDRLGLTGPHSSSDLPSAASWDGSQYDAAGFELRPAVGEGYSHASRQQGHRDEYVQDILPGEGGYEEYVDYDPMDDDA